MKKFIYKALIVGCATAALISCDQEKEPEPVMDATSKPTITINRIDDDGDVNEGDTLVFEITANKMSQSQVTFAPEFSETSAVDEGDYVIIGGVLAPYTTSTTLTIVILDDGIPEVGEAFEFEIVAPEVAESWQLSPASEVETLSTTLANVNSPDNVTIAFAWDDPEHHIDFDGYTLFGEEPWGLANTSDNPELETSISHVYEEDINAYDGTYYFGIDPYDVPDDLTPYTISVGLPDGTVQIFEGTFDKAQMGSYQTDLFGYPDPEEPLTLYRMLVIEKTGDQYTVDFVHD